jgi:glycosyltransferase involved in cell wall biosynthesis
MMALEATVIIPTYNRKDSLGQCLNSLVAQAFRPERFEVVVADDGSTDGTAQIADQSFPFPLRYIAQPNRGSAAARNAGAEQARGNILIFLDDDMLVGPDYVGGLAAEHRAYARVVGMGTERPYLPKDASPFTRIYAEMNATPPTAPAGAFVDFTACVTNNLSVQRDAFCEIGRMQDIAGDGPTWWGDVEFGYRARQRGFRFRRCGRAVCYHRDYSVRDLRAASRRARKAARMAQALFHKFPDVQHHLPMFYDKTPLDWRHDSPGLLVRKLARSAASSAAALRVMERAAHMLERRYPSPAFLRPLYRWIIGAYVFQGYRQGLRDYGTSG